MFPLAAQACISLASKLGLPLITEAPALQFLHGEDVKVSANFVSRLSLLILKDQWNISMVCCCSALMRGIDLEGVLYGLINITHWFNVVEKEFKKINTLPIKSP